MKLAKHISFLLLIACLSSCERDSPEPFKISENVLINAIHISPISVDNLYDYSVSIDITDLANNESYDLRASSSSSDQYTDGKAYFTNINFIATDTRLTEKQNEGAISIEKLTAGNSFIIEFRDTSEETINHGTKTLKANITPETVFSISVNDEKRAQRYRESIQTLLKKDLDLAMESIWAKDFNGAQEGDQTQQITVSYRRRSERSVYPDVQ